MDRPIKPTDSATRAWVRALSRARLRNYRSFFGAVDDAEVLGLYRWSNDLSAGLLSTIFLVEVVLRNGFHHALSRRYGAVGAKESKDWYEYVALDEQARSRIIGITHYKRGQRMVLRVPSPSPDDVVSRLMFGFWPHLLDLKKDLVGNHVDWGSILVDVLPGHRQRQASYWAKQKHRDALFARLDLCNELRNRIAHHEPVWKLGPLMKEGRPRRGVPQTIEAPAPATPAEALARLGLLYGRVTELLGWLAPDITADHRRSHEHLRCLHLLRLETLNAYRQRLPPMEIDLAAMSNVGALLEAVRHAEGRHRHVLLKDGQRMIGQFTFAIDVEWAAC
jgi:hypothetical protein